MNPKRATRIANVPRKRYQPVDWKSLKNKLARQASERKQAERAREVYKGALEALALAGVPFLLGGAYAFRHYTGIERDTKDLDLFVAPRDTPRLLGVLADFGLDTELTFHHWLGKAVSRDGVVIDVIFGSGNGICRVDADWFRFAVPYTFLGLPVRLIPCEEMIWSKGFILERNRYDGADVAHLLRAQASTLNWPRLLARFGENWRVLLSHLVLFGFIYPGERDKIPADVTVKLLERLASDRSEPAESVCRGTLLSYGQYAVDISAWGYADARRPPWGKMSQQEIDQWTAAFD